MCDVIVVCLAMNESYAEFRSRLCLSMGYCILIRLTLVLFLFSSYTFFTHYDFFVRIAPVFNVFHLIHAGGAVIIQSRHKIFFLESQWDTHNTCLKLEFQYKSNAVLVCQH